MIPPKSPKFFLTIAFAVVLLTISISCRYSVAFAPPWKPKEVIEQREINFFTDEFSIRLDSAKRVGQPVFLDFYTDWCGPCRVMNRDVFTVSSLANYYNMTFLNLKVNAEKGEGVSLTEKYGVSAYPTMIFLDANGLEKERVVGFATAARLQKIGRQVSKSRQ